MAILLGAIADDFTGASDLANTLVRNGMRTVQTIGVPSDALTLSEVDAVVVALKSRSVPAGDAVAQSRMAYEWLKKQGVHQVFFKYCSTFDSTDQGNIGPVADALLDACGGDFTIFCPAFPENGRAIYRGYLFVGDVLLSESSMRNHPLTPMTDANLVRVLQRQTARPVGLIPLSAVRGGPPAIRRAIDALRRDGVVHAIVDATEDADLIAIGHASDGLRLVTGGSGVAMGLPDNFRTAGLLAGDILADRLPPVSGPAVVLSGSCSQATQGQVAYLAGRAPTFPLDAESLLEAGSTLAERALDWARRRLGDAPLLVTATAPPAEVEKLQSRLGREAAGALVETVLARIASGLHAAGARRFVVAGGETAGAVVKALGVEALRIGPQIDPGVPWTASIGEDPVALALKSGNFGSETFFEKAFETLRT